MQTLIAQLEKDIRFGCHSVVLEVGRSDAGKTMRRRAREAFRALATHMGELRDPGNDLVEASVQSGLAMMLADLGRDLCLTVPYLQYRDRQAWVSWAKGVKVASLRGLPVFLKTGVVFNA